MDGVVGVEYRAPKAGALPGCATPRHLYGIDSTALLVLLRLIQSWTVHAIGRPLKPSFLLARVKDLLSRDFRGEFEAKICAGDLVIDPATYSVTLRGKS